MRGQLSGAIYTVKLEGVLYALHAFQKNSKQGIKTPQVDLNLIRASLKQAEEVHAERLQKEG